MPGFGQFHYFVFVVLMLTGLYAVVVKRNYVKKIIGLSIFQSAVFLLYISMGKVEGGTAPVLVEDPDAVYSHPLPHVLILTAIVVGISTQALGFAILVRIKEAFGTVELDELHDLERADAHGHERRRLRALQVENGRRAQEDAEEAEEAEAAAARAAEVEADSPEGSV